MAISDQVFLRIRSVETCYLLLRSDTHFHLVKEDAALTESKFQKLLRLYPCDIHQLQKMALSVSAFRADTLRHVVIKGYGAGDELELWLGGDVRRYCLVEDYNDTTLATFFSGYDITRRLPPEWTGLEPRLIRRITWAVNGIALGCSFLFLLACEPYWLWSTLCILCQFLPIVLMYLFPRSFVFDDRNASGQDTARRKGNLVYALVLPGFALSMRTLTDFTFESNAFWPLLGISAVLFIAVLLPMALISRNTRNRMMTSFVMIPLMVFLGMGTVGQANYLLSAHSAQSQVAEVTHKRSEWGIRVKSRYCTIEFPDGACQELAVSAGDYRDMAVDDKISVTHYDGFFHIPFLRIRDIP